MEIETLLTEQRWNILRCLSKGQQSPLQLAESLGTTIANISQQLRLLEGIGVVSKKKIQNREKGKPRSLYTISASYSYVISFMAGYAEKKLLKLNSHHQSLLRIWFIDDQVFQKKVETFYTRFEKHLGAVDAIAVAPENNMIMIFAGDTEKVTEQATDILKREALDLACLVFPAASSEKADKLHFIFDRTK